MKHFRTTSALVAHVVALLVVLTSAGATTQQTRNYGGSDEVSCSFPLNPAWPQYGVTAVCFDLQGSETTANIAIVDENSDTVVGAYVFYDNDGAAISDDRFCDGVVTEVPEGAASLQVSVRSTSVAGLGYACGKPTSPATRGVVNVGLS